jgi:hypothetical protein
MQRQPFKLLAIAHHVRTVEFAARHRFDRLVPESLAQLQRQLRVALGQPDQDLAQAHRHRIGNRAETHRALRRAADLFGRGADTRRRGQRAFRFVEQAAVGVMPRDVRSNSLTPSSSSNAFSCALTAGALVDTLSAARVRLPSRAIATKVFS